MAREFSQISKSMSLKRKETTYWKILFENKWALARKFSFLTPSQGGYSDFINLRHALDEV